MNKFIVSAKRLINRHGIDVTFIKVTEGTYNSDTGEVTNTESEITLKAYPEVITANQYNFPNLIGQTITKYSVVSSELGYKPSATDKVKVNNEISSIVSVKDIVAYGESVIYLVNTVKG